MMAQETLFLYLVGTKKIHLRAEEASFIQLDINVFHFLKYLCV